MADDAVRAVLRRQGEKNDGRGTETFREAWLEALLPFAVRYRSSVVELQVFDRVKLTCVAIERAMFCGVESPDFDSTVIEYE